MGKSHRHKHTLLGINMKELTIILVTDLSNKCDLCLYDYDYAKNDTQLVSSLMEKAISKAESSSFEISLRSTFSDLLDSTPLKYGLKYRSLPKDIRLGSFKDDAKVVQIILCDFATCVSANVGIIPLWPSLHSVTCSDGIDVDKPVKDVISDVIGNDVVKVFRNDLYSIVKSDTSVTVDPSIGNLERFQKAAESESLRTKDTVYVKKYSAGGNTDIVYAAKYISANHVEVYKKQDDSNSDYEIFRSNHFELRIDDKDYLRLACAKVDFHGFESSGKILASFYLTKQTKSLLESYLYRVGSKHKVDLRLHSPDSSIVIKAISAMMKIKRIHFNCNNGSNDTPLLIDVLFTPCSKQ